MNRAGHIVCALLEADEDLPSPEDVAADAANQAEIDRDRKPWEIQHLVPEFFNRKNNKFFGTVRKRFLRGNFVVITNRRKTGAGSSTTDHVVYKLVNYPDSNAWDLKYTASFKTYDSARAFVKAARTNPGMTEDEFREQHLDQLGHLL